MVMFSADPLPLYPFTRHPLVLPLPQCLLATVWLSLCFVNELWSITAQVFS